MSAFFQYNGKFLEMCGVFIRWQCFFRFVFRSCFVNLEVNRENDGGEGERKKAEGNLQ